MLNITIKMFKNFNYKTKFLFSVTVDYLIAMFSEFVDK